MDAPNDFELTLTPKGLAWRHLPSGRTLPVVRGGDGPNDPPSAGGAPANGQPPAQPGTTAPAHAPAAPPAPTGSGDDKTFTQADLDRHAGRRAAEAKRAAVAEVAEQLGVSVDDAKKIIEQHNAAAEAAKTDVEKAKEAQAAAEARAAAAEAKTAAQEFERRVETRLITAGVIAGFDLDKDDEREAATKRIAMARKLLVDLPMEATDDEITAKVAEIKADVPGLFGTPSAAGTGAPRVPSGVTPGKPPTPGTNPPLTGIEAGRALARQQAEAAQKADPLSHLHVVGRPAPT